MFLEMLQQKYGAALEKQAMEKQALNPMQLVQMGRRFVGRGKMDRFNQLINKRNAAIDTVRNSRIDKFRQLANSASEEQEWLGHANGPISRQYLAATNRFISPAPEWTNLARLRDLTSAYTDEAAQYAKALSKPYTASTIEPSTLSSLSAYLRRNGY